MKKIVLTAVCLCAAATFATGAARATVFTGNAAFSTTGPGGSGVTFTSPGGSTPFATAALTAGQSTLFQSLLTVNGTDAGALVFSQTYSTGVSLSLTFTGPGPAQVTQGGQGSETTSLLGLLNAGTLTWSGTQHTDSFGSYVQDLVTFGDGARAYADIYDATLAGSGLDAVSGQIAVRIVDVADPTSVPVPEPATVALLGGGLLGLGMRRRRHRP